MKLIANKLFRHCKMFFVLATERHQMPWIAIGSIAMRWDMGVHMRAALQDSLIISYGQLGKVEQMAKVHRSVMDLGGGGANLEDARALMGLTGLDRKVV